MTQGDEAHVKVAAGEAVQYLFHGGLGAANGRVRIQSPHLHNCSVDTEEIESLRRGIEADVDFHRILILFVLFIGGQNQFIYFC